MVDVVCFQQMFQCPRPLLRLGFDLVGLDFGQFDAAGAVGPASEVGQGRPPDLQHAMFSEMVFDIGDGRMSILLGKSSVVMEGPRHPRCNCRCDS